MRRKINKKSITAMSLMLLLLFGVCVTLALIFTRSEPVVNTFNPAKVACAVVEAGGEPVYDSLVDTGASKTDVQIKNTGDIKAYIRTAIIVNWTTENAAKVWAQKPIIDSDYYMLLDLENGWFDGGDGFYYYESPVSPNELTSVLIDEASLKDGVSAPTGTDTSPYYLSIEIVASAIQSSPATTVEEQWGVTVGADGTITKTGG